MYCYLITFPLGEVATAPKLFTFRDHLEICGLPRICFRAEKHMTVNIGNPPPPPGIIIISVDSLVTLHVQRLPDRPSYTIQECPAFSGEQCTSGQSQMEALSNYFNLMFYIYRHIYISAFSIK